MKRIFRSVFRLNYFVNYKISSYQSKFLGYQSKKGNFGVIKLFICTIWKYSSDFDTFVDNLNYILITERICLERAFQKIKMRDRCKPYDGNNQFGKFGCKMDYIAWLMTEKMVI